MKTHANLTKCDGKWKWRTFIVKVKKKTKMSLIPVRIRLFTDSLMFAVCVGLPYKSTIDCSKLLVIKAVARRFFGKVLYTPLWLISRRVSELLLVNQLGTADLLHFKFHSNYHQTSSTTAKQSLGLWGYGVRCLTFFTDNIYIAEDAIRF